MIQVERIRFSPKRPVEAVNRRVMFTFNDGVMMSLSYRADATVIATISGVAEKSYTYRHNCSEGMLPHSGEMTGMEWCVVGEAFRRDMDFGVIA